MSRMCFPISNGSRLSRSFKLKVELFQTSKIRTNTYLLLCEFLTLNVDPWTTRRTRFSIRFNFDSFILRDLYTKKGSF